MSFDSRKAIILSSPPFASGRDASPKGSLDEPIIECVNLINSLPNYVTTSSCSGRISLYRDVGTKGIHWLVVKHEEITKDDILQAINADSDPGLLVLKCEAFILHILCRDIDVARLMHHIAMECGYRESGISLGKQTMVAVRTTAFGLEMPLAAGSDMFIYEQALDIIVSEANRRIRLNFERIDTFLLAMKTAFSWPILELRSPRAPPLRRWGHSACVDGEGRIVIIGGYGCSSPDKVDSATRHLPPVVHGEEVTVGGLEAMHGVCVFVAAAGHFLLSGGRTSPLHPLPCLQLFDSAFHPVTAHEEGPVPRPRWGHTLTRVSDSQFFLFGGRDQSRVLGDAFLLSHLQGTSWRWRAVDMTAIPPRFFHAACPIPRSSSLLLHGGLLALEDSITDAKFFLIDATRGTVATLDTSPSPPLHRFGHTLTYIGAKSCLLLGGASSQDAQPDADVASALVDLLYRHDGSLQIHLRPSTVYHDGVVTELPDRRSRAHHQCLLDPETSTVSVLGGGMSCLAFGPYYCCDLDLVIATELLHSPSLESPTMHATSLVEAALEQAASGVLLVPPSGVKKLKVFLESIGALDKSKRISQVARGADGGGSLTAVELSSGRVTPHPDFPASSMAVPVESALFSALATGTAVAETLVALRRCVDADTLLLYEQLVRDNKSRLVSHQRKARVFLDGLVQRYHLSAAASKAIPSKYEVVGDVLMVAEDALASREWEDLLSRGVELWRGLGDCFGLHRVARKARVDKGVMRQSRVKMLWSARADDDLWVTVLENNISFSFNLARIMFCSGNCTERMRAASFPVAGQVVVDLYCGIGYYTLPLLVHGKAAFVHCCEINPDSIEALRRNLLAAHVSPDRFEIHAGDNQVTTAGLAEVADHVSLGLLPSSTGGWPLAVHVLKREGGYLHVHENVHEDLLRSGEWVENCLDRFREEFAKRKKPMLLECLQVERVKSYAPRVFHIVVDIRCTPVK